MPQKVVQYVSICYPQAAASGLEAAGQGKITTTISRRARAADKKDSRW
jgi:hypothetical protein